jgi:acyl-[acyl carrier protein]--UDP-N-acetylglucosamine O-acyltransferase
VDALQRAYRILVRSKLNVETALAKIEEELGLFPEARYLVEFVRESKRGIIR